MSSGYTDKMPGTAVNKCRKFVDEVKNGDIAMIVGRDEITFAYIGEYFEKDDDSTTVNKEIEVVSQIDNNRIWVIIAHIEKEGALLLSTK